MISYLVYSSAGAYISDNDDVVSTVAQGQIVFTYFAALAVYTSDVADAKRDGIFSSRSFGVVLILIFLASFVVAVCFILLEVFGYESLVDVYKEVLKRFNNTRNSPPDDAVIDVDSGIKPDQQVQEEKLTGDIKPDKVQEEKRILGDIRTDQVRDTVRDDLQDVVVDLPDFGSRRSSPW